VIVKVEEPITVGHLLSEGHHFCDEKTIKMKKKHEIMFL